MAISELLRNLESYPSKTKTVVLDLQKVIPIDNNGDEIYVISATPSPTTMVGIGGGSINPVFIREFKSGYCKSSGFKNPPYTVTSGNSKLRVSIDGSSYYEITLSSGSGLTGEDVARDLQTQITAIGGDGASEEGNAAFLNTSVKYENGRFVVIAGSVSNTFTGVGKSSVQILPGTSGDASATLGFDIPVVSELIASSTATETVLVSGYTANTGNTLVVDSVQDLSTGMAFTISDGTNREYFVASGIVGNSIYFSSATVSGLSNSYAIGSIIQKIFERDADSDLASPHVDIDAIVRFALQGIGSQIDFSV